MFFGGGLINNLRQFETHELKFYSGLVEWLKKMPMKSATIDQWQATIKNIAGIRQDEIKQSGLLDVFDFFEEDKIDKTDLLEYVKFNLNACFPSLITERARGYQPSLYYKSLAHEAIPKKIKESFRGQEIIHAYVMPSFNYRMLRVRFNDMFGNAERWLNFDYKWKILMLPTSAGIYHSSLEAIDAMHAAELHSFDQFTSATPHKVYERYSLLGGRDYREWFLCIDKWIESYDNSHFDIGNVLVHIRTSHWWDNEGQPLMLVD